MHVYRSARCAAARLTEINFARGALLSLSVGTSFFDGARELGAGSGLTEDEAKPPRTATAIFCARFGGHEITQKAQIETSENFQKNCT